MPLITRNSQNANVKLGTTAQLAAITFIDGDLASDTTLNKLKIFDGSTLQNVGATSFSSSAVVSQSTTIGDYTTPNSASASSGLTSIEYLVIGGGSGGGRFVGGGGGAGRHISGSISISSGTYPITVGTGGAGATVHNNRGGAGSSSVFHTITAISGGQGGASAQSATGLGNGGGGAAGASGAVGTDFTGGNGASASDSGGGGAGSGGNGANAGVGGGNGGAGTANSITGSSVTRAGGGGGCADSSGAGTGTNGGGNGSVSNNNASNATGVGSGGGGSRDSGGGGGNGGNGSDGIVILRYLTANVTATGGTITTSGSYTIHSFTSSGSFVITGAGTSSLAVDDNTATKWTSDSESNPNIYVDMGSALNLCAAAFYFDSTDTTNTEILIQSSADASTWTTRRTITESNLTNGAYNFYRFNIAGGARYIRFYGNSAGSTVLSIWEIKILKKTDAEIFNDLGILTITASDTALGPDGT